MRLLLVFLTILLISPWNAYAQDDAYTIPPPPADMDVEQMVLQVDDEVVTLGDFRSRLRYERFYRFYILDRLGEQFGDEVLNVDDPQNQFGLDIRRLLFEVAAKQDFAESVYDGLIFEILYRHEADSRELERDECTYNQTWMRILNPLEQPPGCDLPAGFEEERAAFIEQAATYAGFSEADLEDIILSLTLRTTVNDAVGAEVELEDVETARSRQILVEDEATANEVISRLEAGEDFQQLLLEYTIEEGAAGDQGDLPPFQSGTSGKGTAFEEAALGAAPGDTVGPVETADGYYIIEVLEQATTPTARARHILLETEDEAQSAIELINRGNDFAEIARQYSIDRGSAARGGDLGEFTTGQMVAPFEEAVFSAETGELTGPVETQFGFHVIEVLERTEQVTGATVRRILVETEEEAQAVLERLEAGEDFADLAVELSIDQGTLGHQGDTRLLTAFSNTPGFYDAAETLPVIADAVFSAEPGAIIGPLETSSGFYVIEVQEFGSRELTPQEIQIAQNDYLGEWQLAQLDSDRIQQFDIEADYVPDDLMPSDVAERLAVLDDVLVASVESLEAERLATTIPNVLRELQLPPGLQPDAPEQTDEE